MSLIEVEAYLANEATREQFLEVAPEASLLHLSTHGVAEQADADLSKLVFAPVSEDPNLYVADIYGMNLQADLVVLSACETGVGPWIGGEGTLSLARAFMVAGSPQVVMSLWSVDDRATAQLMTHFYRGLGEERPPHEALRQAKLQLLDGDNPVWAHPYYWAGWSAVGNGRAVANPRSLTPWLVLPGCALLTALVWVLVRRFR